MLQGVAADLLTSGIGLAFVAAGLFVVTRGWRERSRSARIEEVDDRPAGDLEPGPARVEGVAAAADGAAPTASPLRGTPALAAHVEVEEWQSSRRGGNWQTVHEETTAVPIRVEDGTGAVLVDPPPDATVDLEHERIEVESDEEPPAFVREYLEGVPGLEVPERRDMGPVSIGEPRRYAEGVLEPGEEALVLGRARPVGDDRAGGAAAEGGDEADEAAHAIDAPLASGEFVLSDKSAEELVREGTIGGWLYIVVGAVIAIVGAMAVAFPWV